MNDAVMDDRTRRFASLKRPDVAKLSPQEREEYFDWIERNSRAKATTNEAADYETDGLNGWSPRYDSGV